MESIKSTNIQVTNLSLIRNEVLLNVPFVEHFSNTGSYFMVSSSFYGQNSIESVSNQNLILSTSSVYVFQPELKYRGDSIVPNTISIEEGSFTLIDDGNGNIIDDSNAVLVGNIFYNTGVFVISDSAYSSLANSTSTIRYKRYANFIENKYVIELEESKYTNSSNPTFFESDAPNPFLTKILLYNDNNEIVATATLNRAIELDSNITIILDLIQT